MSEHIQTPAPSMYPPSSQLQQLENALSAAKDHKLYIAHNPKALANQDRIIARYEKQIAELKGDQWLTK